MKYLNEGSRYDEYVREFCAVVAEELGVGEVIIGYQNHTNRPGIEWTQPEIEAVIGSLEAQRVVVDPVSFMHEQSETLAELDDELREVAEGRGLEFHRVPIPYLDARFIEVMTDLVEAALRDGEGPGGLRLTQCRCKPTRGTLCTNGRA